MQHYSARNASIGAITGRKLRSLLTLLGVIFGVATVIVVVFVSASVGPLSGVYTTCGQRDSNY